MIVRVLSWGPLGANGYLVFDRQGGTGAIIDAPPGVAKHFLDLAAANEVSIAMIINTHGHWDHIADNVALVEATGAPLCAHAWDATRLANPSFTMFNREGFDVLPSRADRWLHDSEMLEVGSLGLEVWHTPGHSPGSVCLYERERGALFSGDTLLHGSVGRTDVPGGDQAALSRSLHKLSSLPDATRVFPGHGPTTTIKESRWLLELVKG